MKIAFDHKVFTNQTYGGISRYYTILADELLKQHMDVRIFAGFHRNHYLSDLPESVVTGRRINRYPPKSTRVFDLMNHAISQTQMRAWQPDIIHETYYSALPTLNTTSVRVTSVYDMIHELFADQFSPRDKTTQWKKGTLERVDHIISISHSTKCDLVELFGIDEKKITVVHLGVDLTAFQNNPLVLSGFNNPFVLYVGDRGGYKNFSVLLKAFAASPRLKNELDIVAFGGSSFNAAEQKLIKQLRYKEGQVRQVGGGDDFLASIYHQAEAFVYPSLHEGFGLPPLEAMAAGCPVISSNAGSMPEVIGTAGAYFDPNDIEDMKDAIEKVVFSNGLQKDLITLGFKNVEDFSWEKCAGETIDVYRKITGKS